MGGADTCKLPPSLRSWASREDFNQDHIKINFKIGSEYSRHLAPMIQFVRDSEKSVFIIANSKNLTMNLVQSLEEKLNSMKNDNLLNEHADVIHVHSGLAKQQKFHLINIFCKRVIVMGFNARICVATSAADLGVNNPHVTFVVNFEWFDSIATGVQRKGRSSRNGEDSEVLFVAGIQSYIMLNKQRYQ